LEEIANEQVFLLLNSYDESAAVVWMKRREEVVVAGGGKIERAERAAVNGNDIVEPQGQIGKIVRQNFLNFTA